MNFDELADHVRAEIVTRDPGAATRVVGIDGFSGSGKSQIAPRLAERLPARVLSCDGLVRSWDGLAASIDLLVDAVLEPLFKGEPARVQRFDWRTGRLAQWMEFEPGGVLVVEGCGVGTPSARVFLAALVWVHAPPLERRRRLERREDWSSFEPFFARWATQELAAQAPGGTARRADLVIDNSLPDPFLGPDTSAGGATPPVG